MTLYRATDFYRVHQHIQMHVTRCVDVGSASASLRSFYSAHDLNSKGRVAPIICDAYGEMFFTSRQHTITSSKSTEEFHVSAEQVYFTRRRSHRASDTGSLQLLTTTYKCFTVAAGLVRGYPSSAWTRTRNRSCKLGALRAYFLVPLSRSDHPAFFKKRRNGHFR